ncbi:polysaccharide biosynthesis C-terminal domain-containing protein, partial [Stenotrophomonas maltophilia group sp. RNC7]|uniref:lipid II flippase MurJ n=1 Tax=Stenotrophomonas maltophilia group sp. RNC7 TaxID=3071467 RepID=UPI0027DF6AEC
VSNIVLNFILVKFMGHSGLAFATSIATIIATIIMLYGVKKKIGLLRTKNYIITFFKIGLASILMGIVTYSTYYGLYKSLGTIRLRNLISLFVAVGLSVIVYVTLCY